MPNTVCKGESTEMQAIEKGIWFWKSCQLGRHNSCTDLGHVWDSNIKVQRVCCWCVLGGRVIGLLSFYGKSGLYGCSLQDDPSRQCMEKTRLQALRIPGTFLKHFRVLDRVLSGQAICASFPVEPRPTTARCLNCSAYRHSLAGRLSIAYRQVAQGVDQDTIKSKLGERLLCKGVAVRWCPCILQVPCIVNETIYVYSWYAELTGAAPDRYGNWNPHRSKSMGTRLRSKRRRRKGVL